MTAEGWQAPGSYALIFHLHEPLVDVPVGRLGRYDFAPGTWIYCGSAWGPGGLRARLRRHLRREKRLHWHIDYLTAHCAPASVLVCVQSEPPRPRLECLWSRCLLERTDVRAPIPGFGSSDCHSGCPAHLLHVATFISIERVRERLASSRLACGYSGKPARCVQITQCVVRDV